MSGSALSRLVGALQSLTTAGPTLGLFFAQSINGTTTARNSTGGSRSVFVAIVADGTLTSDNKGNTYTAGPTIGTTEIHRVYTCVSPVGGPGHTWTIANGSGVAPASIVVIELLQATSVTIGAWSNTAATAGTRTANAATVNGVQRVVHVSVSDTAGTAAWTRSDGLSTTAEITNGSASWALNAATGTPASGSFTATYTHSDSGVTTHDIVAVVSGSSAVIVGATQAGAWSMRNAVSATAAAAWSARNAVGATKSSSWSARNSVGTVQTGAWSVRSPASATQNAGWSIRNTIGASQFGAWSVLGAVIASATQAGAWTVRNSASGSTGAAWSVRIAVVATKAGAWTVRGISNSTQAGAWTVRNAIVATKAASWSVLAAGVVTGTASSAWTVRASVASASAAAWSVRNSVAASVGSPWSVRNVSIGAQVGAWSVLEAVVVNGSQSGAWRVWGYANATQVGAWSVESALPAFTADSQRRIGALSLEAMPQQVGSSTQLDADERIGADVINNQPRRIGVGNLRRTAPRIG